MSWRTGIDVLLCVDESLYLPRPAVPFREFSLLMANPVFMNNLLRYVTAVTTLDRDRPCVRTSPRKCGHLFRNHERCLGLTLSGPARQPHESKRDRILDHPSKSGRLKRERKPGFKHEHLQDAL